MTRTTVLLSITQDKKTLTTTKLGTTAMPMGGYGGMKQAGGGIGDIFGMIPQLIGKKVGLVSGLVGKKVGLVTGLAGKKIGLVTGIPGKIAGIVGGIPAKIGGIA